MATDKMEINGGETELNRVTLLPWVDRAGGLKEFVNKRHEDRTQSSPVSNESGRIEIEDRFYL